MGSRLDTQEYDIVIAQVIQNSKLFKIDKGEAVYCVGVIAGCRFKRKSLGVEAIVNADICIVRLVKDKGAIEVATSKNLRKLDILQNENGLIRINLQTSCDASQKNTLI